MQTELNGQTSIRRFDEPRAGMGGALRKWLYREGGVTTLPMQLSRFTQAYENLYPPGTVNIFDRLNEAVKMSGTFLNILPLLVLYFVLQRWFVESIEMTGVTGE